VFFVFFFFEKNKTKRSTLYFIFFIFDLCCVTLSKPSNPCLPSCALSLLPLRTPHSALRTPFFLFLCFPLAVLCDPLCALQAMLTALCPFPCLSLQHTETVRR